MTVRRPVVVVTRPAAQAQALLDGLRAAGVEARALPLIAIEFLPLPSEVEAALKTPEPGALWIFTSVNAVDGLPKGEPWAWPEAVAAIGEATARRLAERGVTAWTAGGASRSEELLADARLAEVRGRAITLIGGEGGRGVLARELAARGARLREVTVYRRVPVAHPPEAVRAAADGAALVHFTSAAAIDQWLALHPDRNAAFAPQWVVVSPRLAAHAHERGYPRDPVVLPGPGDDALIAALPTLLSQNDAMTDAAPATEPSRPAPPPSRARRWPWAVLGLLIVLLAVGGWVSALRLGLAERLGLPGLTLAESGENGVLEARLSGLERELAALRETQRDERQDERRLALELAQLRQRLEATEAALGGLIERTEGGRERVVLATAEQLLLLANDRLRLAGDARGAREALTLADERLASLADPRLYAVRAAINDERAALAALPQPDRAGVALALDGLIQRIGELPLDLRAHRFEPPEPEPEPDPATTTGVQRLLAQAGALARQMFVLRRDEARAQRLLSESEAPLVSALLHLKLENARAAWLSGDAEQFLAITASARDWLAQHYALASREVAAMDAELERLQTQMPAVELPDISRSLVLLRAQMEPAPR